MTSEELSIFRVIVKKGLENCTKRKPNCDECPFVGRFVGCSDQLMKNALQLIQEYEREDKHTSLTNKSSTSLE